MFTCDAIDEFFGGATPTPPASAARRVTCSLLWPNKRQSFRPMRPFENPAALHRTEEILLDASRHTYRSNSWALRKSRRSR